MVEMTLAEITADAQKTRALIQTTIDEFETRTGVQIEGIDLRRVFDLGNPKGQIVMLNLDLCIRL